MTGANPELWDQWSNLAFAQGFFEDILPTRGKRPFLRNWTKTLATDTDLITWRAAQHNIGIRASYLRAIDIDIEDDALASRITAFIRMRFGMPLRYRSGTGKCLLAFCMTGDFDKLSFKCKAQVNGGSAGSIEFLANRQQFVVAGMHPSGTPYEWSGGLPEDFPILSTEEFEKLWADLQTEFSLSPQSISLTSPALHTPNPDAFGGVTDAVADYLRASNLVAREDNGRLHLYHCPWEDQHTDKLTALTQATYFVARTNGYEFGHFDCRHEHCKDRSDDEFRHALGCPTGMFGPIGPENSGNNPTNKFQPVSWDEFSARKAPDWIVKGILPRAELAVIYGASGSGKTFMALDLAFSIARGIPWRSHRTAQGRVIYICAEGIGGFRNRLKAYALQYGLKPHATPLEIIAGVPNLLLKADALDVAKAIGQASVIIIDTFAQTTAGGNENSGEDMGRALAHCKGIHLATGALVVLIHHAGKDETRGARGWSGIRAAADAEIEVFRFANGNGARITKQKDADDSETWSFSLKPLIIGIDGDNESISSCYVEYSETALVKPGNLPKRGTWQNIILETFDEFGGTSELVTAVIEAATRKGTDTLYRNRHSARRALETLRDKGEIKILDGVMSREL